MPVDGVPKGDGWSLASFRPIMYLPTLLLFELDRVFERSETKDKEIQWYRCRSSVVEHVLGKDGVRSSILRGSTSSTRHIRQIA